jgi:hypothetical protein
MSDVIPVVDVRDGGPVRHALEAPERARALRDDCVAWLPWPARALLPVMDALTRRWLVRSRSRYIADVAAIAAELRFSGIWFLNGSYEWGCTALARDEAGAPWLARTLDWPFPGLGRRLEIARLRGAAGDYLSVTWPGYCGVLSGMAEGRFAAVVNQAPLRRHTRRPWLRPYDLAVNAFHTWRIPFSPPDHLLREVFETCRDFDEARQRLERTPVAHPVIYMLVGCRAGERCVIERTEEGATTRTDQTVAANDWMNASARWEARVSPSVLLTRPWEEAAERNRARQEALAGWAQPFTGPALAWVTPPVLNPMTRLAIEMCPASGILRAAGYEQPEPGDAMPERVTEIRELAGARLPEAVPAPADEGSR